MKICLIGHYGRLYDEGGRNVALNIARGLSKYHEIMKLNVWDINTWRKIRSFRPQIIHYIPNVLLAFAMPKILSFCYKDAKTVMSAHHLPAFRPHRFSFKTLMPLLNPDITLIQSYESEQILTKLGYKTQFLPNGVDTEKFTPASKDIKEKLREKYGLDKRKFIVLHVGSIRRNRNIQVLNRIQHEEDVQVVIIGTSMPVEHEVYKSLIENGCIVWRTYFENIEEIYALSDCYIFPVINKLGSIELPLSVFEAMSCNLPVITTKFGGLERVFKETDGLEFVNEEKDFVSESEKIKKGNIEIKTREKILPYSWENISKRLEEIYEEVLKGST